MLSSVKYSIFTCICRTEEDIYSVSISHRKPEGKVDKVCCFINCYDLCLVIVWLVMISDKRRVLVRVFIL